MPSYSTAAWWSSRFLKGAIDRWAQYDSVWTGIFIEIAVWIRMSSRPEMSSSIYISNSDEMIINWCLQTVITGRILFSLDSTVEVFHRDNECLQCTHLNAEMSNSKGQTSVMKRIISSEAMSHFPIVIYTNLGKHTVFICK